MERRYPALRAISVIYKVLAVLALLGCLAVGVVRAIEVKPLEGIFLVAMGIVYGIFLWAGAELILVLLDIEQSTRRTAELLSERAREEQSPRA